MGSEEHKIIFIVMAATITAALLLLAVIDLFLLYRHRKLKHEKELDEHKRRIDDLLQKQEVENVNAMLKGQDAERKRIAQELHDRLGSILSTVKLHFSAVEEQMNALKQQQHQSYGEATLLLDEAVDEVRRISHDLYEGSLAKFGFKTALLQLISAIEKANTVKILFIDNGVDEGIYKNHAQELYRITQELLSNTLKYSGATEITLQLSLKENTFDFMYEDNGKGFDKKYAENGSGIGYKNIAARVAKLNGNWHLDTHPGHGMTLLIEIPV
ncbi:histidine kinase [Oscillatoria amoena NRMC-F 0135]|nr:histidine kinase [Oscillatoria amoena NRMC-F 0135]